MCGLIYNKMNLESDLLPWLITILILFVFVQFVYIMFLIQKIADLREALFRDSINSHDHKVIEESRANHLSFLLL